MGIFSVSSLPRSFKKARLNLKWQYVPPKNLGIYWHLLGMPIDSVENKLL
jgi:hypothetical protein